MTVLAIEKRFSARPDRIPAAVIARCVFWSKKPLVPMDRDLLSTGQGPGPAGREPDRLPVVCRKFYVPRNSDKRKGHHAR